MRLPGTAPFRPAKNLSNAYLDPMISADIISAVSPSKSGKLPAFRPMNPPSLRPVLLHKIAWHPMH